MSIFFFLKSFLPEIVLSLNIFSQLIFNIYNRSNIKHFYIINKEVLSQILTSLFCLLLVYFNSNKQIIFYKFFFINSFNETFIKIFFIVFCLVLFVTVWRAFLIQRINFFEFFTFIVFAIFSLLLLINSLNFIAVYLLIELQALCFYILSCFNRTSSFSTEAGLKYFISGSFISGFFLFGCSLVYSVLGTLNFNQISLILSLTVNDNNEFFLILVGILFIIVTFLFKISAAPFHFWSPDVYEGSPLSATIVFSIIPKLFLMTFLIIWLSTLSLFFFFIRYFLILVGLFSVFVGTFFAIYQKRFKRIVIYSSIAQIGFLILGLTTSTLSGLSSVYFFLIVYLISSLLLWSFITLFYMFQKKLNFFEKKILIPMYLPNLVNFFQKNPLWSLLLTFIFFSLAGIPPFIGFFSKFFIINGLIEVSFLFTGLLLILISVISVFYYIRFIKLLFFEKDNLSYKNIEYQTIFLDSYVELDLFIIVSGMFLLFYVFFNPNFLLLISQLFSLSNLSV